VVRIHPWEPFFAVSTNRGIRVDIRHRQIAASYMVSSHCPEGGGDPFEDSQDMPRIKTGQQADTVAKTALATRGVLNSKTTVVRHGKQTGRLNDMRTKS
jgi:hypothetical protein